MAGGRAEDRMERGERFDSGFGAKVSSVRSSARLPAFVFRRKASRMGIIRFRLLFNVDRGIRNVPVCHHELMNLACNSN